MTTTTASEITTGDCISVAGRWVRIKSATASNGTVALIWRDCDGETDGDCFGFTSPLRRA